MKKILYMISSIKQDGPNLVLENMIYGLDKSKYEIYVISFLNTCDNISMGNLEKLGAKIINFNYRKKIDILLKGKKDVKKIIDEYSIDIIHSHGILPDIVNGKIKKEVNILAFSTIHNNMYEDYVYSFGRIKSIFFIKWHQLYLRRMDKCICCSKSVDEELKKHLNNTSFIQNSIYRNKDENVDYIAIRKKIRNKYNIPENSLVYIYVGRLSSRKNTLNLVDNFLNNINNNEYLLILGDGELRTEMERKYSCKNIIFCGFCKNRYDYLIASDIYYSCSLSEGFSISVLEALENNNLLFLSDIPSHKEIFEIDKIVYIGEYFNQNEFKEKKEIIRNIEPNFDDIRNFLDKHLSCKAMMEKYSKEYELEA